jgi:non-specific serine/threonine protein kinase
MPRLSAAARPALQPGEAVESPCTVALTPHGRLTVVSAAQAPPLAAALAERLRALGAGAPGHLLLGLGAEQVGVALPPVIAWWRDLAARYLTALCTLPEAAEQHAGPVPEPDASALQALVWSAPPMIGAEYLTVEVLQRQWQALDTALHAELMTSGLPLGAFLKARNPAWNLVGRVHLHLAENRQDDECPFAFLATYTTRLSAQGKAQHRPLGEALREYADAADRQRLLALLAPLQRAGEACAWLKDLIDRREIFQPLRFSVDEALALLNAVPEIERAGVVVRLPAQWRANRPARAAVSATVGERAPSRVGQDALLDFKASVCIDGEPLTDADIATLLADSRGLVFIRGQWVQVDAQRLQQTLTQFQRVERLASEQGLGFFDAMRLLAGASVAIDGQEVASGQPWTQVNAGPWLAETLAALRGPPGLGGGGCRPRPAGQLAALPATRPALAALAVTPALGRLSGRRHGPGQDDPGAGAPAGAQARRGPRAQPAGGAGLAVGQLGAGGGPLRAGPARAGGAPLRDARQGVGGVVWRAPDPERPRHHQLRLGAPAGVE